MRFILTMVINTKNIHHYDSYIYSISISDKHLYEVGKLMPCENEPRWTNREGLMDWDHSLYDLQQNEWNDVTLIVKIFERSCTLKIFFRVHLSGSVQISSKLLTQSSRKRNRRGEPQVIIFSEYWVIMDGGTVMIRTLARSVRRTRPPLPHFPQPEKSE